MYAPGPGTFILSGGGSICGVTKPPGILKEPSDIFSYDAVRFDIVMGGGYNCIYNLQDVE